MSYQADHMAWQQRVGLELNAHKRNLDKVFSGGSQFGANQQLYDLYQSIISESQKSQSASGSRKSNGAFSQLSKHLITFGGRQRGVQNPVLAGAAAAQDTQVGFYSRPQTRDMDAISQASGAYVGKRSTKRPARQMSATAQSKTIKLTPNARTFYPEEYYKRVGYQKSETKSYQARVDALGQRVRDRFNEDGTSEYKSRPTTGGLHTRTLQQLKQSHGKQGAAGPLSQASRQSDVFSQNKRRSMAPSQVSNARLPKAEVDLKNADAISVITVDRLKKFNDIQGTVAGNVLDEIAAKEAMADYAEGEFENNQEKAEDAYGMQDQDEDDLREEEKDEMMPAMSTVSKQSRRSNVTSKTYISKLEKQLEVEKLARLKLEQEVEEMKKINAEISSKLGLSNP